jgi:hypothetical protein
LDLENRGLMTPAGRLAEWMSYRHLNNLI